MRQAIALIALSCWFPAHAQLSAGATIGWSRSQHFDRGAPTFGLLVERPWERSVTRVLFEQQLPATSRWDRLIDGSRMLATTSFPADGHLRRYTGSDAVVMLSIGMDHLLNIDAHGDWRVRAGPGLIHAAEHYASNSTVDDLTTGTRSVLEERYQRSSTSLRFTAEVALNIAVGELVLDATSDVFTWCWRSEGDAPQRWAQRVYLRFGALFPLYRKS